MNDAIKDNAVLFAIVAIGGAILIIGYVPPYHEMLIALGAAFIIAGGVGIYMMLATRQVAKNLHERFNVQNEILKKLDGNSSKQTEILKDIASSQKQNHSEMMSVLKEIKDKL
jgi:uncharacterized membrane protein